MSTIAHVKKLQRVAGRLGVALVVMGGLGSAARPVVAADPEPIEVQYHVYGSGFHMLDFELSVQESDVAYRVDSSFRTLGMIDFLIGFSLRSEASGRVTPAGLRPDQYSSDSTFRSRARDIRVRYADGAAPTITVNPPDTEQRTPIRAETLPGTIDALTATLEVARAVRTGSTCDRVVPVFDGRRRYDLVFTDAGVETLKKSSYSAFFGEARRCSVKQVRIGGFMVDQPPGASTEGADIWIAPVAPGAPPLPVRIEFDSSWGTIYVHLAAVKSTGRMVRLDE